MTTLLPRIRKAACGLALGAGLLVAPAAQAGLIPTGYAIGAQQFGLSIGGSPNAGAFQGTWNGSGIVFFCIELTQTFSFGGNYTYQASIPDNATFTLLGKLFTAAFGSALSSTANSAAFQLAVWEIVYDGGNLQLGSGSFKVLNDYGQAATVTQAQAWLNALANTPDSYTLFMLNNAQHQNFVTADRVTIPPETSRVPEPGTAGLLLMAIVAAWSARACGTRRRDARRPD